MRDYFYIRKVGYFFLFLFAIVCITGCQWLNPNIMFKTGRNYKYAQFKDSTKLVDYKISINDVLDFQLYSNDGFKLIDLTSIGQSGGSASVRSGITYLIESDGCAKLPILGRTFLKGLTIRQAESMLEEKFSVYYNKPFALMQVINRRVIIFPGLAGAARVLSLTNNNTTLLEALALAGGISANGKAKRVKLIRGDLQNPDVYLIDLSTIDGIKRADLVLQGNDIIYVEPRLNMTQELLNRITPVIGLISSTLLIFVLIRNPLGQ